MKLEVENKRPILAYRFSKERSFEKSAIGSIRSLGFKSFEMKLNLQSFIDELV
jgi:hypothetical protein